MSKKIVAIGGGTGLSTLLRGLKEYPVKLTAVVAVTDEGGSSGKLRKELKIIPPGDIRNCLTALSAEESLMSRLFQYRFKGGSLYDHSFGNLFLAAISDLSGGFEKGIAAASKVLAIKGDVVPVTLSDVRLKAKLSNGSVITGERKISSLLPDESIKKLYLVGKNIKPHPKVISSILHADFIILGPGSLYTSIISNLLVPGINDAIKKSPAKKIYISNIMTQPGETDDYSLSRHINVIKNYSGISFDYIFVNKGRIRGRLLERYLSQNARPVKNDLTSDYSSKNHCKIIYGNFVSRMHYARHSPKRLAKYVMKVIGSAK